HGRPDIPIISGNVRAIGGKQLGRALAALPINVLTPISQRWQPKAYDGRRPESQHAGQSKPARHPGPAPQDCPQRRDYDGSTGTLQEQDRRNEVPIRIAILLGVLGARNDAGVEEGYERQEEPRVQCGSRCFTEPRKAAEKGSSDERGG